MRQIGIAAVAGILGLGLVAGLSSPAWPASGPTTSSGNTAGSRASLEGVTLHVGDINSIQQLVTTQSGALEGAPYKVSFTEFATGPSEFAGLESGAVDIGFTGDTPAVFAFAGHVPFKVVAALPANGSNLGIVVPKGSPIRSLKELRGKSIAVSSGTSDDYLLFEALKSVGLTPHDVTKDNLSPALALAALKSGSVQAAALLQPYVALEQQSGARVLVTGHALLHSHSFSVASTSALSKPAVSAAMADYLKRLGVAFAWTKKNRTQWIQALATQYKLSPTLAATLVGNLSSLFTTIGPATSGATQTLANVFYDLGELSNKVNVKPMFDARFNSVITSPSSA